MTDYDRILLNILQVGIQNDTMPEGLTLSLDTEAWKALFERASQQGVLPLVVDTVCVTKSQKSVDKEILKRYKDIAVKEAVRQIVQTNEFLTLLLHLQEKGLSPIVVKGIACRFLYPKPMLRPSVDEDLFIEQKDGEKYHNCIIAEGLYADEPETDWATTYTWSYHKENSPTYIELQTELFDPSSKAYGHFNELFVDAHTCTITIQIEDVTLRTLHPTDHLMFLLCHALKHFIHSGLGIRPVCDICLFVQKYHDQIDWDEVARSSEQVKMTGLTAGILRICEQYLGLERTLIKGSLSEEMQLIDEKDLLEDILESGIFGTANMDRMHSSTLTLQAVANTKIGKNGSISLVRTVFPPARLMKKRFPYLQKRPWLLPAAWMKRIFLYSFRKVNGHRAKPLESVRIGRSRVELMKKYGILE